MDQNNYTSPEFKKVSFHCPHCQTFSLQNWFFLRENLEYFCNEYEQLHDPGIYQAKCYCCDQTSYWLGVWNITQQQYHGKMIWPITCTAEHAHKDIPESIKDDFEEARSIVQLSPKGAAALLRLAIQKLMVELGEKGENINADIKSLVSKGLPIQVQQALDYCRVTGNNAVHPAELNLDDTPEMVNMMFKMINIIIDRQISLPKQITAAFDQLPEGAKTAINKRDS